VRALSAFLLRLTLWVYPYVFALTWFVPASLPLVGKNVYVASVTAVIVLVFLIRLPQIRGGLALLVAFLPPLALVIIAARVVAYQEAFTAGLSAFRAPLTMSVYACAVWAVSRDPQQHQALRRIVIVNAFLQAVAGIVHNTWLPHVVIGGPNVQRFIGIDAPFYVSDQNYLTREGGLLISPNVYANFIALGILAVVSHALVAWRRNKLSLGTLFPLLVMLYGLSLSGSRLPVAVGFALVAFYLVKCLSMRALIPMALLGVLIVPVFLPFAQGVVNRLGVEGSGDRLVKARLAVDLITRDPLAGLVGVPIADQATAQTLEGVQISDSSFLQLALGLGIPYTLFFAASLGVMVMKTTTGYLRSAAIGSLVLVLALTNAISWDIWLVYWFATAYSLRPRDREPTTRHVRNVRALRSRVVASAGAA